MSKNTDENVKQDKIVEITKVKPNPDQSGKVYDENELKELTDSIKEYGMISPVLVVNKGDYYEIITGVRRWQAAKFAGLKEILIHEYSENELREQSLIDDIQRTDRNPVDEAKAYKELTDEFGYSQTELAEKVAKSREEVSNTLKILNLPKKVQDMIATEQISIGHARVLLSMENPDDQYMVAKRIVKENLTISETKELVKNIKK